MQLQIYVLVEDISRDDHGKPTEITGQTRTITYAAFKNLDNPESPRYKLLGQSDEDGNLIPGNPNLNSQHRVLIQAQSVRNAVPVADVGQPFSSPVSTNDFKPLPETVQNWANLAVSATNANIETAPVTNPIVKPQVVTKVKQTRNRKPKTVEA